EVHDYASGKAVNAARVLHTLGYPTRFIGLLGGHRGSRLKQDLDQAGIETDIVEVEANTRLCVTVVNRAARQATELIEESAPVAAADADQLLERLTAHLPGASVLIM